MAGKGSIYKRCGCRNPQTKKRLEKHCPRLQERGHGTWYYRCPVTDMYGRPDEAREGSFPSKAAATRARDTRMAGSGPKHAAQTWTVERWLIYWLTTVSGVKQSTAYGYAQHVAGILVPMIGKVRLADLTGPQLTAAFTDFASVPGRYGRLRSQGTLRGAARTLRTALNAAVRVGVLADNPSRRVEVVAGRRPHGQVWTDLWVGRWKATGLRPAVAVWTVTQLAEFLTFVTDDPLFALWWLVALRGLRRGELAGLRWRDIDLVNRTLTVAVNRVTVGRHIIEGTPKSEASRRTIALDRQTVRVLRAHQARKRAWHKLTGLPLGPDSYVFTRSDGQPYNPNYLTHRLALLIKTSGLPPVRLHDLRHGAASTAHAAGVDLKNIQDQLGHASIVLTADTYTSVMPTAQRQAAEDTARLVLTAARGARAKMTNRCTRGAATVSAAPASTPVINKTPGGALRPSGNMAQKAAHPTRTQHAPTVHKGTVSAGKQQVNEWAAWDSNPEPMD
jgi:integrase